MLKKKLKEIITIVEESEIHEVEVSTWWGRKIRVSKNTSSLGMSFPHTSIQTEQELLDSNMSKQGPEAAADTTEYHEIQAPIVGTFYRAPSPESSSYINVGDKVSVGQIICIIEAMKIMNEIESDVTGTVVEILVENATPVEFNQPLVVVNPS